MFVTASLNGLGKAKRKKRACKAYGVIHELGSAALSIWGGQGGSYAGGINQLGDALYDASCGQSEPAVPTPDTSNVGTGAAQLQAAMAQYQAQIAMLTAQQQAAQGTPPPPVAGIDKQTLLIGGAIAAGLVLVLAFKR